MARWRGKGLTAEAAEVRGGNGGAGGLMHDSVRHFGDGDGEAMAWEFFDARVLIETRHGE